MCVIELRFVDNIRACDTVERGSITNMVKPKYRDRGKIHTDVDACL